MKNKKSILSLLLIIILIVILLISMFFFGFDQDVLFLFISLIVVIYFVRFIDKKKDLLKEKDVTYKDFRKIVFLIVRIVISAVIIFLSYYVPHYLLHLWNHLAFDYYIVVAIVTSVFLLNTSRLFNSVKIGTATGALSGLFFFIFHYNNALSSTSEYIDWGLIYMFSMWFTLIWIFSCITGAVISYFIRRVLKEKVNLKW
jgi:hypothetical protein